MHEREIQVPAPRRFTVDEYYRMAGAGILGENDRVELIDGEVTVMSPIGKGHAACVGRLTLRLVESVGKHALVWVQNPIHLGEFAEPQPDVALLRPRRDFYAKGHPGPKDVLLLIEVSDETLRYDRRVKLPLYARAGIPEVWIVDLKNERVEVHRRPRANGYAETKRRSRGAEVSVLRLPGVGLGVGEILG